MADAEESKPAEVSKTEEEKPAAEEEKPAAEEEKPAAGGASAEAAGDDDDNVESDSDDEVEEDPNWEAGFFEDDLPRLPTGEELEKLIKEKGGGDSMKKKKGGDDDDDDDEAEAGDGPNLDDDDEDDDDDEEEDDGSNGFNGKLYKNVPARNFDPVKNPLDDFEGDLGGPGGEEFKTLSKLIKLRKSWVNMGPKRNKKGGMKKWQKIDNMTKELLSGIEGLSDVNVADKQGLTLLALCFDKNYSYVRDIKRVLIKKGADPNRPDKNGRTCLHHVMLLKEHEPRHRQIRVLLAAGANPNLVSKKGELPLLMSFSLKKKKHHPDLKCSEVLVRSGKTNLDAGVPGKKGDGPAPLIEILQAKKPKVAEPVVHLLTHFGADCNARIPHKKPNKQRSALWIAFDKHCSGGFSYNVDCIGRLNEAAEGTPKLDAAIFNEFEKPGKPKTANPLFLACLFKQSEAVKNFLRDSHCEGSDPEKLYKPPKALIKTQKKIDKDFFMPEVSSFEAACLSGAGGAVSAFIKLEESKFRPILIAPPKNWNQKWLGKKKRGIANIPIIVTGVMKSNHADARAFAQMALDYEVHINEPYPDAGNMSLFMMFCALGHSDACHIIMDAADAGKVDLKWEFKDDHGRNIVWYAAYGSVDDRTPVLKRALLNKAENNTPDEFGVTPLMAAFRNGDWKSVSILMNKPFTYKENLRKNPEYKEPVEEKESLLTRMSSMSSMVTETTVHGGAQTRSKLCVRKPSGFTKESAGNFMFRPFPPYKPGNWEGISGAELNKPDNFGFTMLWYAVLNRKPDLVRMLLEDPELDVNPQNTQDDLATKVGEKMTPIMLSVCVQGRGCLPIFFMLLRDERIDLSLKNSRGHTVRDLAFMQEIEFMIHPMTDALDKVEGAPDLHSDVASIEHFREADKAMWWAEGEHPGEEAIEEAKASGDGEESLFGDALGEWAIVLKQVPHYEWSYWLRSVTNFDLTGRELLKLQKKQQRWETTKNAAIKAGYFAAKALTMVAGAEAAEAAKRLVSFGEKSWWAHKGQMVRGYDRMYLYTQAAFPDEQLADIDKHDAVGRRHLPEDFDILKRRYHVGRSMKTKDPKPWKPVAKGGTHRTSHDNERWMLRGKIPSSIKDETNK